MTEMRIAVMGAAGRMGRELVRAVHETQGCVVAGGTERSGARELGMDLGEVAGLGPLGVKITDDPLELFAGIDAALDFTSPKATVEFAALAANARIVHVIGTTGLDADDAAAIAAAARHATIVRSGNMSLGVNLLAALTRRVAQALDADFDIEIVEMHHRHKVDAPSGTALMLGEAAAAGRDVALPTTLFASATAPSGRAAGRHRLCDPARRQRRRRAHGDLRGRGRAHRAHASRHRPRHLRARRGQGRAVGPRQGARPFSMSDVLGL